MWNWLEIYLRLYPHWILSVVLLDEHSFHNQWAARHSNQVEQVRWGVQDTGLGLDWSFPRCLVHRFASRFEVWTCSGGRASKSSATRTLAIWLSRMIPTENHSVWRRRSVEGWHMGEDEKEIQPCQESEGWYSTHQTILVELMSQFICLN